MRLRLRRRRCALSSEPPDIFHPDLVQPNRWTIIFRPAVSSVCGCTMFAENREWLRMLGLTPKPAWAEVWHLWTVIMPRRSITGRLLTGQVWRRHDGRRWIYKKFIE